MVITPSRPSQPLALCIAVLLCAPVAAAVAASGDGYTDMLDYLATSRIDGSAFAGANGAVGTNLAAGDHNLQANLRSFAIGRDADAGVAAHQVRDNDHFDTPAHAAASIGGQAFRHASGLVSINQASGSGNAEMNIVAATLAHQGIREATDGNLSTAVSASAGGQHAPNPTAASPGTRSVAVESTAMQGFEGVLQLNQIAGSGNSISNQLGLSVEGRP